MLTVIVRGISKVMLFLSAIFLVLMVLHVTADVAMKFFRNKSIEGTIEIVSAYYMVGAVFLPIAAVDWVRGAISVDMLYQNLPHSFRVASMIMVLSTTAVVYAALVYTGFGDAMKSFHIQEKMSGTVLIDIWPSRFLMPVGFACGFIVCLYQLVQFIRDASERERLLSVEMFLEPS